MSGREESSSGLGVVILFVVAVLAVGFVLRTNLLSSRMSTSEGEHTVVPALRTYLGAQNQFHRTDFYGLGSLVYANPKDGTGFSDLYELPDGTLLKMLDASFADATLNGEPRAGYLFCDIRFEDYTIDCGLCAFPEAYGESGRNTFIIDVTGVVYQKDNEGRPVTEWPDPEAEGWVAVGSG